MCARVYVVNNAAVAVFLSIDFISFFFLLLSSFVSFVYSETYYCYYIITSIRIRIHSGPILPTVVGERFAVMWMEPNAGVMLAASGMLDGSNECAE